MRAIQLIAMVTVSGCMSGPSTSVAPRQATRVSAPQTRTWDAVVDVFADRNIAIRTMDRSSGFIATDELSVSRSEGLEWADCGKNLSGAISPDRAVYNVLTRGDSSASTVKATVRWVARAGDKLIECTTKGTWEREAEADIKQRAERLPGRAESPTPTVPSQVVPAPPSGAPARRIDDVPPGTNWVADAKARTYYRVGCPAAAKIAPADRLYYGNESSLEAAGFKKSEEC